MKHIKINLTTFFAMMLIFSGCAHTKPNLYETRFNDALTKESTRHFVSAQPFEAFSNEVVSALNSLAYGSKSYDNPAASFFVMSKNAVDADAPQIMVKFTQWQGGQTRVDFFNGSTELKAKLEAQHDLAVLVKTLEAKSVALQAAPVTDAKG